MKIGPVREPEIAMIYAKMSDAITMLFGVVNRVLRQTEMGQRNHVLVGVHVGTTW